VRTAGRHARLVGAVLLCLQVLQYFGAQLRQLTVERIEAASKVLRLAAQCGDFVAALSDELVVLTDERAERFECIALFFQRRRHGQACEFVDGHLRCSQWRCDCRAARTTKQKRARQRVGAPEKCGEGDPDP